jgi:serine/threonine protein kinase
MEFPTFIKKCPIPDGTLLDSRYQVQTALGQGGLGRTYLALDNRRFEEKCVLKEFCPNTTDKSFVKKAHELFEREAQILYKLNHPQIPKFHAWFEAENRLFLVQDYVEGQTYKDLLRDQAFSETEIIQWLKNLLPVLDYIHRQKIIHRDISPENIMQPYQSSLPVLIDFGVVQIIEDSLNSLNSEKRGSIVGKVGYSPPEQLRTGRCFPNSDLYALGVTAIVLLTGQSVHSLLNTDTLKWDWGSFVTLSALFTKILDKLVAEHPKDRYQSATEALLDLKKLSSMQSALALQETVIRSRQKADLMPLSIVQKVLMIEKGNAIALSGLFALSLMGVIALAQSPHIPFFCDLVRNCAATKSKSPEPPLW